MTRFYTMIVVISGISILFYFAGLTTETNSLTSLLLNPGSIASSGLATIIAASLSLAVTIFSIVLGTRFSNIEIALAGPIGVVMLSFLWELITIYRIVFTYNNPVIAILIFSPILFILGLLTFDWVRGRDA